MKLFCSLAGLVLSSLLATGCSTTSGVTNKEEMEFVSETQNADFEKDRQSILAMAGDYMVTFDFTETVAFLDSYDLKEPKISGGYESVRVIEDTQDYISLQHILVVGDQDDPHIVKHWRQDWRYEPKRVLMFVGGNAWQWKNVSHAQSKGRWSQTVYQVDDTPRYGAVGSWTHDDGIAEWTPPREWRPLPRRDMTTRDDYHAVNAVNRHTITSWGWVHEQDNSKLILDQEPQVLVREVGINTYRKFEEYPVEAADAYWSETSDYWAGIRAEWNRIEAENDSFAVTLKGETTDLYMPLLDLANMVQEGDKETSLAIEEAKVVIAKFVTSDIGNLKDRLRPSSKTKDKEY